MQATIRGRSITIRQMQTSKSGNVLCALSKINPDLELRLAVAARPQVTLDFDALVSQDSPLFIDSFT